jgi:hypothetical protein
MKRAENDNWLDDALARAIGSEKSTADFEKWKQNHPEAVEMLTSRADWTIHIPAHPPNVWRIIMKSPITKIAAATVIITTIVLSIVVSDKLANPAYAITDLPRLFEEAKVIHVEGWQYFPNHRMPDGRKIPPVEIDNWIDLENGQSRMTGTGLSVDKNSVRIMIAETISSGQYELSLNHTDKNATFFKISDYQRMLTANRTLRLIRGQVLGVIEQLENFKKVGQEEIDGVKYDIWLGELLDPVRKHEYTHRLKIWVCPDTGELARTQIWWNVEGSGWELEADDETSYNVEIPNGVFEMTVPQGYVAVNTKEQAIPMELGGGGVGYSDDKYSLSLRPEISFTMRDGSVLLGWSSSDSKSKIPPEEFSRGLEFGGSLPKLPVEIYALKLAGVSSGITYTGYHLTCTQKAGKFIEWSIFVPDGKPPAGVELFGYDVIYRFNLEPNPKWIIGLTAEYGLLIETAEEFDKWVLGAMAELSDNGKAPTGLTYERVLQLAEEVRKSPPQ